MVLCGDGADMTLGVDVSRVVAAAIEAGLSPEYILMASSLEISLIVVRPVASAPA
jgi:hypothetical protein